MLRCKVERLKHRLMPERALPGRYRVRPSRKREGEGPLRSV